MTALPTGTVTLLFTDIEGSTLLLRRLGERYGEVLSQQRAILRSCVARHDGHELGTEGDSFFVHTSSNDTVRNRELWTVTHIGDTGELTVTHFGGHGTVTLPADYVREHVRLGYAAPNRATSPTPSPSASPSPHPRPPAAGCTWR